MPLDCVVCGSPQVGAGRCCVRCGTEFTLRNIISAYAEKVRIVLLPQTSAGKSGIACPRCENIVPLRACRCESCQLTFSHVQVLRVLLRRAGIKLGLLPMKPIAAKRYSVLMALLLGATLLMGPPLLMRTFPLGAIAIGFVHGVLLMTFAVSLFVWVAGRELLIRIFVESPPAARIGHFCALVFAFLGLWGVAMFTPVPTTSLLLILAGLWAAVFIFLRFVVPFVSEIVSFLLGGRQSPGDGFDPAGPQGRNVKVD